jgi:homopolymeric O-antigen transport system permease protein
MHAEAGSLASPAPTPLRAALCYVVEIWEYRHFWISLVRADLRRRYRRSLLGVGWSLLQPIIMTLVLSLVYSRLLQTDFSKFGPMLLTGFAVWNYVHGVAMQGCHSLLSAEGYIRQQSIPLAIYPLRTVLMLGFHFLISLSLALGLTWAVSVSGNVLVAWHVEGAGGMDVIQAGLRGFGNVVALWSLIPTLILLFLFGWAVGILTGFAHVYFPDTQHFAEVVLQMLFFLTPIMYPPSLLEENGMAQVTRFNPVARLVTLVRLPILYGQSPTLFQFSLAAGLVAVVVMLAVVVLWRCERRLVFAL